MIDSGGHQVDGVDVVDDGDDHGNREDEDEMIAVTACGDDVGDLGNSDVCSAAP